MQWPSGQGEEIGTIAADWATLSLCLRREQWRSRFYLRTVHDGSIRAFLLHDPDGAPITLVESNVPDRPGFAVIADRNADLARVLLDVQRKISTELQLQPAPHLISHPA